MEDFIHFLQYVDDRIKSDQSTFKSELTAEFDIEGEFMGFSGPTEELDKLYNAPSILYSSIFITLYSFFELKFTALIIDTANTKKVKISITDLKADNDINRAERYLNKVLDIDLLDMESDFKHLHEYRRIRNVFVHQGGLVSKEKEGKPLFDKIQKSTSFYFYADSERLDSGHIRMEGPSFVQEFARFIPKFSGQIFNKLYPVL